VVDSTGAVFDSVDFLMVGVICNDWPSWCYALSHKCFSLEFIGVTNEDLLQDITETFSDVKVFLVCHEQIPLDLPSVDILCFNGSGSFKFSIPPTVGVIVLFDWKFRNRGKWRDWRFTSQLIAHSECGGTSSFSGHITFGYHSSVRDLWPDDFQQLHASYPTCNLGSLIKCTVGGQELLNDPGLASSVPPHTVGHLGKNLYHYKGLFPFGSWRSEFITPCVFYKLKLVRRRLSSNELQEVLDVPVEGIRKRSFLRLLPHFKVPIKVLSAIVSHCIMGLSSFGTGGILILFCA
jgi:hypothetical protein